MRTAWLGMYDFPWLQPENDALWAALRRQILALDPPVALNRSRAREDIWHDPALLLAQTCGYPLMTQLQGVVRVVATPIYDLAGCEAATHCSFIVVRADDAAQSVADLRGGIAAINGYDSNSGMNLLRAAVAPFARLGRFFAAVVVTGGHLNSAAAVRAGQADAAAIDCVTFGLTMRDRPDLLAGLRVLARTPPSPCLPFVTGCTASQAEVVALRDALHAVLPWPGLALAGVTDAQDYRRVIALEQEAGAVGVHSL